MARHDAVETYGQPLKFDPDFKGPLSKRSCTDIPCLLLFVAFLVGWGAVAYYALRNGDLDRLLVPTDSNGLKCGVDSEVLKEPYLVFFDITECAKYDVPLYGCKTPQVCVSECPNENFRFEQQYCNPSTLKTLQSKLICEHTVHKDQLSCEDIQVYIDRGRCAKYYLKSVPFAKRCISDLPDTECPYIPPRILKQYQLSATPDSTRGRGGGKQTSTETQVCAIQRRLGRELLVERMTKLQSYFSRYVDNLLSHVTNNTNVHQTGQMVVEDILETWKLVIIFMLLSLLASLIFITMLRWIAKPMVWISILGVIAALCYGVYYSYSQYSYIRAHPVESHINVSPNLSSLFESWFKSDRTWLWILVILSIILVVLLLVVLVLRKRIVIAIALVKEGSKAVSAIFSTVFFPIIPWVLHILVIVFAVAVGLYLASIGEPVHRVYGLNSSTTCVCNNGYKDGDICDPIVFNDHCHNSVLRDNSGRCMDAACHFQEIHSPKEVGYFHAINVVGFFWGICFVSAFGDMVLAFTFATWYWTFHKRNLRFFVLTTGFMRTVRYHLGTLAVGALIIAICKIIRAMLEYIDHKLRKFDNGVVRAVLCVCKCCFWCLENFLKFLNTNAYIMCAIHGKNFCSSAKDAFSLLARNVLRVIALDKVTGFLFFLSKLLLACGMAAVTYVFFDSGITPSLHFPLVPAILVFIGTYVIASVFFSVYSVAVDTLFLCFLEDCERNDGSAEKPYFMSKNLMKILGKKQKFITNR
ncbi:choline transporter-like 2 isoform X2 [Toxorhynchites rutilus septentrionalis]|uniref:choline transporter-like 2 isoform X2 n=1 Tax=Toxorhynchites rutilus septentrionalis TaxID=329112 RepID=UPI002479E6FB|nr:choline transporter-like 2 isoform X2 [Toxorhynchites rutilus septentrionalis]XP_055621855.1 choline transporter-like 2 isoform X2 [Toxorhynchites rutilus septentrionalis]XP_055621857.1 choline transporter-like 2 isoform X2 [Toxorhynchites rutilus septentrionalis]